MMKRLFSIVMALTVVFSICGCSKTNVNESDDVTLTFICGGRNISTLLEDDEAERVISILNGINYNPVSSGIPSCGFDKNVSLKVGNRIFAIACDTCNCVQDLGNLKYFDIPGEDMEYIHSLFEKYGGYFPCI